MNRATAVFAGLLVIALPLSLLAGRVWLDPAATPNAALILAELRLPRALLAIVVGAGLGASGAAMQGYLRNPLADPGLFGIAPGAALGAVAALWFGYAAAPWLLPAFALAGFAVAGLAVPGLATDGPVLAVGSSWAWTFLVSAYAVMLGYEWTHYLVHSDYRPRSRWYCALWRNHRLHHYKNEHYWFAVVTAGTADRVLGPYPEPSSVASSPTVKALYVAGRD